MVLRRLRRDQLPRRGGFGSGCDAATLQTVQGILDDVRSRGMQAVAEHGRRLGDLQPEQAVSFGKTQLRSVLKEIEPADRAVLERTAARIRRFAAAQLASLTELRTAVAGGEAGHTIAAMPCAGCYAPGGRFPLPSSVLMTVVTARVAGVETVWVASPRPAPVTLAAAAIAGADGLLAVGGAQAIAALAYGAAPVPACDVIVGPGNRWVTAAKQLVAGAVAIDMLAGPSELVILADGSSDAATAAADLLAQAEHDPEALPILVSTDATWVDRVRELADEQLSDLPTAETARPALENGFAVIAADLDEAVAVVNEIAPEHLEVLVRAPEALLPQLKHYGGLFLGEAAAEVLGDYGAGPNHVLPTGGQARSTGGLSVANFLRIRSWLRIDDPGAAREVVEDAIALARLEGLEAHARSAERRLVS